MPDRVTMETCAPGVRPYSGANDDVCTRNSSSASAETSAFIPPSTLVAGCVPPPVWFKPLKLIVSPVLAPAPSTMK